MFEKRLKELNEKFAKKFTQEIKEEPYYILSNYKAEREIYFKGNKKAIEFIKEKFKYSPFKKFIYFLITLGVLQPLLKKIELHPTFGDVIYVANNIKAFDLTWNTVMSFPKTKDKSGDFLEVVRNKDVRKELSPKLLKINNEVPYIKEELLKKYDGDSKIPLTRLKEFNERTGFIHGSLADEHILMKDGEPIFIDWDNMKKGTFIEEVDYYIHLLKDRRLNK